MPLEPVNLYEYEARAKQVLPHNVWDFPAGGSMDEVTMRRNRSAFEAIALRPRFLWDVSQRDLTTTVLGSEISMPLMIAPASTQMMAHPEGEVATIRAAGMSGTLMMLSIGSNRSMEEVAAAATGPAWFMLTHLRKDLTENLVRRAEDAGFRAIVITIETPLPSPKDKDLRNRWEHPAGLRLGNLGLPNYGDLVPARLTWEEIEWVRSLTRLPIVLKGVMTAEDAHLAVEHGIQGIYVSNNGGRHVDMVMSAIEMLPEVSDAVNGKAEIYFDSGIRRGSDVLKALALGARAVAIGRPLFWGLAVNGAEGVHHVLELLRKELDLVMGYCGQTSVHNLEPNLLDIPLGWGSSLHPIKTHALKISTSIPEIP